MSTTPLPTCDLDAFCCAPPGHDGACLQPFETEYRVGACSAVPWFRAEWFRRVFVAHEKSMNDWLLAMAKASQADLFG